MPENPQNPLKPNKELEAEVKRLQDYPVHPLVSKISQKLGAFNLVRNARNQKQVDIEEITNQ